MEIRTDYCFLFYFVAINVPSAVSFEIVLPV